MCARIARELIAPALSRAQRPRTNVCDLLTRVFKGCIHLKAAPNLNAYLNFVTADYCARHRRAGPGRGKPGTDVSLGRAKTCEELIAGLPEYGYNIATGPYRDWQFKIEASGAEQVVCAAAAHEARWCVVGSGNAPAALRGRARREMARRASAWLGRSCRRAATSSVSNARLGDF